MKKPSAPKKPRVSRMYDVTLRRDVQQIVKVRVEASSSREAIDVAECVAEEETTRWRVEEHIGTHRPEVK